MTREAEHMPKPWQP